MQATHAGNQTMWIEAFKDAVLELDPRFLPPKLVAAQAAIEDRLLETGFDGGPDREEVMKLEDAKRTIMLLWHEEQT
jgi:hypothetical protein